MDFAIPPAISEDLDRFMIFIKKHIRRIWPAGIKNEKYPLPSSVTWEKADGMA